MKTRNLLKNLGLAAVFSGILCLMNSPAAEAQGPRGHHGGGGGFSFGGFTPPKPIASRSGSSAGDILNGVAGITLVNPKENGVSLQFTLDGEPYSLQPGYQQQVRRVCVIEFDKGGTAGTARYSISAGVYKFTPVNGMWDLFHSQADALETEVNSGLASNPVPAM